MQKHWRNGAAKEVRGQSRATTSRMVVIVLPLTTPTTVTCPIAEQQNSRKNLINFVKTKTESSDDQIRKYMNAKQ